MAIERENTRQPAIVGAWLVFVDQTTNDTFVVRNKKTKYTSQKVDGQLNCPAETYDAALDHGSFVHGTIPRAIEEEVGQVAYNPNDIVPLGLIRLPIPERTVVAAPYLIPIANKEAITFDPTNPEEVDEPQWINLADIKDQPLDGLKNSIPLYRGPMREIAQMALNRLAGGPFTITRSKDRLISQEEIDVLEMDASAERAVA